MYKISLFFLISAVKCGLVPDKLIPPVDCVIPRNADNIVRAALLQQCLSPSKGRPSTETRCFKEIGCFPMNAPWTSNLRPFPQPMTPEQIDVKLHFYSRDNPNKPKTLNIYPDISIDDIKFDPTRPYTTFMTHGFASNGNTSWILHLKDNYLEKRDANVFIVDWRNGSNLLNYLQVASNTRVVGAIVGRFLNYLRSETRLKPSQTHLIGHSLGAHISGYIGKANPNCSVITALDPAQPGFEGADEKVRLSKNDGNLVQAVHTSARPFIPLLGFGFITTIGHVDFYFNGGALQPKCTLPSVENIKITSIADLALVPVEVLSEWVGCSHNLAHEYYSESLLTDNCTFVAKKAGLVESISSLLSAGYSKKLINPIQSKFVDCNVDTCSVFGLDVRSFPAFGSFSVETRSNAPYCKKEPRELNKLKDSFEARNEEEKAALGTTTMRIIFGKVSNVIGKIKPFV